MHAQKYESYLTRCRTEMGAKEASSNQHMLSSVHNKVHDFVQHLQDSLPALKTKSVKSHVGESHIENREFVANKLDE